jgi:hypothetical protein
VEGLGFFDFIDGGIQIQSGVGDLGLEISHFSIELLDTLLEVNHGLVLVSGQLIDGVDNGGSELLELVDDLLEQSLVGEVLAGSER